MALQVALSKRVFEFSFNARTSRGAMKDKVSWFVNLWDDSNPEIVGVGECGPLPGLSPEFNAEFEAALHRTMDSINKQALTFPPASDLKSIHLLIQKVIGLEAVQKNSSLVFALETALLDCIHGGARLLFRNSFVEGTPIPINGLIWMGGLDFMLQQIEIKIRDGFTCLKLKVGSHDFEKECDVLQYIRRKYFRDKITIRLDANGAFKKEEALFKINQLTRFDVHSIEQPIKPGLPELNELCVQSPIPIALDEELIGVHGIEKKRALLTRVRPQYIILKPSLHGGLFSCSEWIQLSEELGIGWWMTSALESNIGLNAIAQFTANYPISLPQGLGTGMIYNQNVESPLTVINGQLQYQKDVFWGKIDE